MSAFVDFQQVKAEVSIEEAAKLIGLKLTKHGEQLRAPCPACKGADARAIVITPARAVYYCFKEQKGGDCIALTAHVRKTSMKEAAGFLAERFLHSSSTVPAGEGERGEKRDDASLQPLSYLKHDHDAVVAVGFEPDDAKALGIGFASKGMMRGLVAVPVRMPDGTLAGYIGITEAKLPTSWRLSAPNVVPFQKKTA